VMVDMRIRSIRAKSPVPISELSRQDPLRRQFGPEPQAKGRVRVVG